MTVRLTKEEREKLIVNLYCVEQQSPQSISRMCAISIGTVYSALRERKIKLRGRKNQYKLKQFSRKDVKYVTSHLEYLYNYLDLTSSEIAILFQTTKRNIEKILQRRGIKKCVRSS